MENKKYCTIRETASVLGIADCRLREWQKQNLLPGFYAGSRFYVDVELFRKSVETGVIGTKILAYKEENIPKAEQKKAEKPAEPAKQSAAREDPVSSEVAWYDFEFHNVSDWTEILKFIRNMPLPTGAKVKISVEGEKGAVMF